MTVKKKFNVLYTFLGIIGLSSLGYAIYLFHEINKYGIASEQQSNLGQFLGGTSGFFISLTSIIALAIAFIAQRHQIVNQQDEIRKNESYNKKQSFQNNFYKLIEIYQGILNNTIYTVMDISRDGSDYVKGTSYQQINGKTAIKNYYDDFCKMRLEKFHEECEKHNTNKREIFNEEYKRYMRFNQYIFGHYFRIIYHILKLIREHRIIFSEDINFNFDDKFYSNILRAQISSAELMFIFFNGLSDLALYKSEELNFKKLIEEYVFFEHITFSQTFFDLSDYEKYALKVLMDCYDKNAYGENYEKIKELVNS